MPKERIRKSGREGYADLLVQWGRDELGEFDGQPKVRLFIIASDLGPQGAFLFEPNRPEEIGLPPRPKPATTLEEAEMERLCGPKAGPMVGPVDIMLDREQINRAIRVLRRARDAAYGRDE